MSFGLPSIKVKPEIRQNVDSETGTYGVPEVLKHGYASASSGDTSHHPLISTEQNYHKHRDNMNMAILRNTQGLHAPLRIHMEMKAAKRIGRLPFLPSSNVMLDSLTGRDLEVGPEDVFNTSEFREVSGQPHAMIEKSLGLL